MVTLALPARSRAYVYAAYALAGVIIGSLQVAYAAAEAGQPTWLTVALAVFAYVGGAIGYTAASHTPARDAEVQPYTGRHHDADGDGIADHARP